MTARNLFRFSFFAFLYVLCDLCGKSAFAGDWVHWRGPTQDGVTYDTGLPVKFSLNPNAPNNNLIWAKPKYGCRSTPVVMGGRVYFLGSAGDGLEEGERLVCLNADSGDVMWEDKMNIFHSDIQPNRLGWTSPVGDPETGNVYIHGTQGFFRCYDKDGKIVWQHNLSEEYGRVTGYGGRVVGPTLDGDLVIAAMISGSWGDFARGANRFVAFDKKSGQVVWWSSLPDQIKGTYYSNPIVATINGQRLLITGGADGGLHALQVRTGKLMWSYHFGKNVINASPVVEGNYVYCSHGEENLDTSEQGRLVCVDAGQIENGQPKLVWEVVGLKFGYASPVVHKGELYVCTDSARLYRYEAKTGKPIGRPYAYGRLGRGSPVFGDGKIYLFNVNGELNILEPTAKEIKEFYVQRFRPADGRGFVETNGTPAIANGRVYFGTLEAFYCIGTKDGKAGEAPKAPAEAAAGAQLAQVAVFPADVVLKPGGNAEFEVRAFDANGQAIKDVPQGKFQITLPPKQPDGRQPPGLVGELNGDGAKAKLVVSDKMPGQQGYVDFVAGEKMIGRARIRVAPQMPYKQDFDRVPIGATPGGWINTMGKFNVVKKGDDIVLRKVANNPSPPVARANAYIGLPEWSDYTIQADMSAEEVRGGRPDFGLLNTRYHLLLDGKTDANGKRRLRIASWEARPRIDESVVFDWNKDTWYTLKLRVEVQGKVAVIQGKAWERGKPEPEKWTIEFNDPSPNREGAPALYAYIANALEKEPGAEAYFDNVVIMPNHKESSAPPARQPPEPSSFLPVGGATNMGEAVLMPCSQAILNCKPVCRVRTNRRLLSR
jgi:outer membrane protein assembly factor BamB